jgi:2'-5' RNA ligase
MTSYMMWLVPASGFERDRLAATIGRLAAEHAAPVFAPHVTMVGTVDSADAAALARTLGTLLDGVPAFDVSLTAVGHEPVYFRSLYLHAEPSEPLMALHEAGKRAWGLELPPFRPHLSLLYSDLPEGRKRAIIDGLGLTLPVTIHVDAAELWADFRQDVTAWRRAARIPLAG